jgi:hypothetical protein
MAGVLWSGPMMASIAEGEAWSRHPFCLIFLQLWSCEALLFWRHNCPASPHAGVQAHTTVHGSSQSCATQFGHLDTSGAIGPWIRCITQHSVHLCSGYVRLLDGSPPVAVDNQLPCGSNSVLVLFLLGTQPCVSRGGVNRRFCSFLSCPCGCHTWGDNQYDQY